MMKPQSLKDTGAMAFCVRNTTFSFKVDLLLFTSRPCSTSRWATPNFWAYALGIALLRLQPSN